MKKQYENAETDSDLLDGAQESFLIIINVETSCAANIFVFDTYFFQD